MARFQYLHPICIGREANIGNKGTTSKPMILVEFLNLRFDLEADIKRVSNVKFIPLVHAAQQRAAWRWQSAGFMQASLT